MMTRGDQYLDQRSENFSLTACRPAPHRSPLTLTTVTTITTTCSTWKHLQHFSVSTSVLAWNPNCLSLTLLLLLSPSFSSVDSMSALSVVEREVWRVGRWEKEGGDSRRRRRETWGFRWLWKTPPRFFTPKSTQDSDMVKKHLHLQLTAVHSTCFYRCQNGNHQLPVQHAHTQNVDHVILEPECYDHVTVQNT